jgi:hypothetical protein
LNKQIAFIGISETGCGRVEMARDYHRRSLWRPAGAEMTIAERKASALKAIKARWKASSKVKAG